MDIKFKGKDCVVVTQKMHSPKHRPPVAERKFIYKSQIMSEFLEKNPKYEILSCVGPDFICNFRGEDSAKGEWSLEIKEKSVAPKSKVKKTTTPKLKNPTVTKTKKEGV